jgi:primosomal protein N' (replication factor Y)
LSKIFPAAKIARADMDTTKKKRLWGETLEQFEQGEIDILVGTQTITKGYHFPNITLVGIIWADLNVHFPVFNASERALQQLIQVAGRAGRQSNKEGLVIAQIMHDHPIFSHLNEENYLNFCKEEMEFRKETLYPPYGRFVQIELKHTNGHVIEQESQKLFELLSQADPKNTTSILGPTRPLVYRIQKTEIRHIFLKAENFAKIYTLLKSIDKNEFSSKIFIVPT